MKENQESIREIFEKRISLIADLSALNAQQLQNTQQLSGNELNFQRCTECLEELGESRSLLDELAEIEARERDIRARIADCEIRIGNLEEQVSELDHKLEHL